MEDKDKKKNVKKIIVYAGKKLCAINQITETAIIHPVIDRLLLLPDKQI